MIKEKFSSNVGITYFFSLFKLRKTAYPKAYFFLYGGRAIKLELKRELFKKLIGSYLDFYFEDFYSHNNDQYFPLSGKLMKVKGKGFYKMNGSFIKTESINWIWFLRPALNYVTNLKIHKLTGSTSRLATMEKKYKDTYDVGLLPNFKTALKELNENNKLYAQW